MNYSKRMTASSWRGYAERLNLTPEFEQLEKNSGATATSAASASAATETEESSHFLQSRTFRRRIHGTSRCRRRRRPRSHCSRDPHQCRSARASRCAGSSITIAPRYPLLQGATQQVPPASGLWPTSSFLSAVNQCHHIKSSQHISKCLQLLHKCR
jgi:hypothetical protein